MTSVRLAYNPGPVNAYGALSAEGSRRKQKEAEVSNETSPTVRLALSYGQAERNGTLEEPIATDEPMKPALLVSYCYLDGFLRKRAEYSYRDWVLDSGAFSAHNSGVEIKLQDYIDTCKRLRDADSTLTEIFALDVIGDWKASVRNAEEMWRQGVEAIPCFHYGSPWDVLTGIAKDYPKIAIGGCVGRHDKDDFAAKCFARVWPKKMHGFGFGGKKSIMLHPWHSVDATNWEIGPCKYGGWRAFGKLSVRGSKQNLRKEVEWYLKLEEQARWRWKKEMAQLDSNGPTLRLADQSKTRDKSGAIR